MVRELKLFERIFFGDFTFYYIKKRLFYILNVISSLKIKDSESIDKCEILIVLWDNRSIKHNDENIIQIYETLKNLGYSLSILGSCPTTSKTFRRKKVHIFNRKFFRYILQYILNSNIKLLSDFWRQTFLKFNCKVCITYQPTEELCMAAKDCDCFVIDLQHGEIFKDHNVYRKYQMKRNYLPNLFLAWDKDSSVLAKEMKISEKVKDLICMPEFINDKQFASKEISQSDFNRRILISLTDDIHTYYRKDKFRDINISDNIGVKYFKELFFDKDFNNILWIIRLHPNSNKNDKFRIKKNIRKFNKMNRSSQIIIDNKSDLVSQIITSDIHITLNSSVAIKASSLGLFTITTCPETFRNSNFNNNSRVKKLPNNYKYKEMKSLIFEKLLKPKKKIYLNSKNLRNKFKEQLKPIFDELLYKNIQ